MTSKKYHVLKYRPIAEATQLTNLIASISNPSLVGSPLTAEEKVRVPGTHTRPGKGGRRKQD